MIGIETTFYGFGGSVVEKAKKLIVVFESLGIPPFVQIGPSSMDGDFETTVSRLNSLKDKHGVEYSLHQSIWLPSPDFFLNLGSSNEIVFRDTINSIKRSIDFARKIGAKNLSFHGGCAASKMTQEEEFEPLTIIDSIPYEEAYSNVAKGIKEILRYAKNDVKLNVENINYRPERRYLFSTPEDFRKLPNGVFVLFDVAHAYFSQVRSGDSLYMEKMVKIFGGKISEMHVSDNDGSEDQHKLPGGGEVPLSRVFKLVVKRQRLPPVIIEATKGKNRYSEDDLKESIKFLDKLIDEI